MADQKGDHDRVQVASRFPDGSPAQTPDFEFIGDKEYSKQATHRQLTEQSVSAIDVETRGATTSAGGAVGSTEPDEAVQKLKDLHDKAASAAEKQADKEVEARFATRDDLKGTANPAAPDNAHDGPRK